MASRVEVRFIDQSDFVNKGNGFLLKGSPDWELDSTISLEMTYLLDDISVYQEELKAADSDPNQEISVSVLEPWQEEINNSKRQTEEWE